MKHDEERLKLHNCRMTQFSTVVNGHKHIPAIGGDQAPHLPLIGKLQSVSSSEARTERILIPSLGRQLRCPPHPT